MGEIHISTADTFFDAPELDFDATCQVCLKTCRHEVGWIGMRCSNCRFIISDETWIGDIVRERRERVLKLNRREMSELSGYSPKTIKTYEWTRCTQAYVRKTSELIRQQQPRSL